MAPIESMATGRKTRLLRGCFAVFMAFVFLLGGPYAEAGPFLRSSGYIYTANKRPTYGQHDQH
eukprot:916893-Prymnesium_polylepis.1